MPCATWRARRVQPRARRSPQAVCYTQGGQREAARRQRGQRRSRRCRCKVRQAAEEGAPDAAGEARVADAHETAQPIPTLTHVRRRTRRSSSSKRLSNITAYPRPHCRRRSQLSQAGSDVGRTPVRSALPGASPNMCHRRYWLRRLRERPRPTLYRHPPTRLIRGLGSSSRGRGAPGPGRAALTCRTITRNVRMRTTSHRLRAMSRAHAAARPQTPCAHA